MDQRWTEMHRRTRSRTTTKTQWMERRRQASRAVPSVSTNRIRQQEMMRKALSTTRLNHQRTLRRRDTKSSLTNHISLHKHIEHKRIGRINSAAMFRMHIERRRFIRITRISTSWQNSRRSSRLNMRRHLSQGRNWKLSRFNHQFSWMPNRLTQMNFLRIKTTCKSSGSKEAITKVACNWLWTSTLAKMTFPTYWSTADKVMHKIPKPKT